MPVLMTEEEWRDLQDLRQHWHMACDCDPFPGSDTFMERMEARGYATLRAVTRDDLDEAFAAERGIEKGGMVWCLTDKGLAAIDREETC